MTRKLLLLISAIPLACAQLSTFQQEISADSIQALYQGNDGYSAAAKPFNERYNSVSPIAIVYPNSANDVSEILKAATQSNLTAQAKSGGHSYATLAERNGSITINLSNMRQITVDNTTGIASIEAGNRLGDVALTLNNYGRALPCPYVGVGGHVSMGGWGFSSRQWGMSLDNLIALDLVLANGTQLTVSNQSYPDLWYAMRGAGSSFAIVTTFHFQTFPAPSSAVMFNYKWNLDVDAATDGLVKFQSFSNSGIPKELGPEIDFDKGSSNGTVGFSFHGAYYGSEDSFNATVAPYLAMMPANPQVELVPGTWIEGVQKAAGSQSLNTTGGTDYSDTFYAKSLMTPESEPWSNASIRAFVQFMATNGYWTTLNWFCQVELYGGSNSAVNAVPTDATAFVHRDKLFNIQFYASSASYGPPYPEQGVQYLNEMVKTITSNEDASWPYGAYVNYIDSNLTDSEWQLLYYPGIYNDLSILKAKYDPTNVFQFFSAIQANGSSSALINGKTVQATSSASPRLSAHLIIAHLAMLAVVCLALF